MSVGIATRRKEKKVAKPKPDELLASVIQETAIPGVVELLRANTPFVFPSGTAWAFVTLDAEAIGGLSKRHSRDEAKGSMIELIHADHIQTIATADMLAGEYFGIIPTPATLDRMDEFRLLRSAAYRWAVAWQVDGGFEVTRYGTATLGQLRGITGAVLTLEQAVGAEAWAAHSETATTCATIPLAEVGPVAAGSGEAPPVAVTKDPGDPLFDVPVAEGGLHQTSEVAWVDGDGDGADGDDEPVFTDTPGVDDEPMHGSDETAFPVYGETVTPGHGSADEGATAARVGFEVGDGPYQDGEPDWADDAPEATAPATTLGVDIDADTDTEAVLIETPDQARAVVARRFLAEELHDVEIRIDEFEAIFAIGTPAVRLSVPEGATAWLGEHVAQLTREANADLTLLRQAHEHHLRSLYVTLYSDCANQVLDNLSIDREGSRYRGLLTEAESAHRERKTGLEAAIREAKAAIVRDYEQQAKRHAEQAALQAELSFKERNRSKMEREQAEAATGRERALDDQYDRDRQDILQTRRNKARLDMQRGVSGIIEVIRGHQNDQLAAERQRMEHWQSQIRGMIDDNRKADIAQIDVLGEQQRISDEIADLHTEHADRTATLRQEHEDRLRRMEAELDRQRQDTATQMAARDEEWRHSLALEQEKTGSQSARVTDLLAQLDHIETSVERRFEARITELQTDKDAYAHEMQRAADVQRRSNAVLIVMLIALALVVGGAGFVAGVVLAG